MDETKTKRRWFQFHLATAVLIMMVAGGLLLFQFRPYRLPEPYSYFRDGLTYGWPVPMLSEDLGHERDFKFSWEWPLAIVNLIVNSSILAAVAVVTESFIHRREARKP